MTNRVSLQPAYILHSRPYRDSSMLIEALTAEQGRVSLVARGARRRSRGGSASALLQPFVPLLVGYSGRAELKTLTATEAAGRPPVLDGVRLFSGLYLNELLVRLLHRYDPHPRLFACYAATLEALAGQQQADDCLRRFEITLLVELGYGFDLELDGRSGGRVAADSWYQFHPEYGLVACEGSGNGEQPAFCGADLLAIAADDFSGSARTTAKRLLRLALAAHLGDAPLRSRELFAARVAGRRPQDGREPEEGG